MSITRSNIVTSGSIRTAPGPPLFLLETYHNAETIVKSPYVGLTAATTYK